MIMKTKLTFIIAVFTLFALTTSCNKDKTNKANFNDVKITVKFDGNKKSQPTIPMTKETPDNYYIALSSATLIGNGNTEDFELFSESNLASSFVFDFTDGDIKRSLLQGTDIPDGDYSSLEIEIYYLQMNLNIATTNRGVEKRDIRIYLSDDNENEGGLHQPGDMTQINSGTEIGWLLGEGQTPDLDPVTPRVNAYTHNGDGTTWYTFDDKTGNNYGPFGNMDFWNSATQPIYKTIVSFDFDDNSSGETVIVEFNVEDCWQFEDKSGDGYFGATDLDPANPTKWHMELPKISVYKE